MKITSTLRHAYHGLQEFRCYERAFLQQSTVDEGHKIATVDEGHKFAFKTGWDQTDYCIYFRT